jgi:hypothetical protein
MANDAAQATSAAEEDTREKFTVVTVQPHHAVLAGSPAMSAMGPRASPKDHRVAEKESETAAPRLIQRAASAPNRILRVRLFGQS